jgi:hypothetical protein
MASDTPTHAPELGKVSDALVATFVSTILHDLTTCSSLESVCMQDMSTQLLDVFIGSSKEKVSDCSMTDRHTRRQTASHTY